MSTANRVIKNTGYLYAKMAITMFISLYTTRLVLAALGEEDFGVFGVVGGSIAMLSFLNGAMASATQRFMSFYEGAGDKLKQKKIFNNSIILHWIVAFLVVALLEAMIVPIFNRVLNIAPESIDSAKSIYHFMVVSTFFTIISVPYEATINAHENMLFYSILGIFESFIKLGIAFWVTYTMADKLMLYGLLMAGLTVLLLIIKRIYCRKKYAECSMNLRKYYDKAVIKELSGFFGWNFLGSAGSVVGNQGNGLVINHYFGTAVNAAMGVSSQLQGQLMTFSNNMLKALNPVIVKKMGEGDIQLMLKYSLSGSKLSYIIYAFFALPCIVEAPYILNLWLLEVPEWTIVFFRCQLIIVLFEQLTCTLGTSIASTGKIRWLNILRFFDHLLMPALFAYVSSLGFSPFACYLILIANVVLLQNNINIHQCMLHCGLSVKFFILNVVLPCMLCSVVALIIGFSLTYILSIGFMRLCIAFFAMTLIYSILLWIWGFDRDEKELVLKLIKEIKNKLFQKRHNRVSL